MPTTDKQIIVRTMTGDMDALKALYDEMAPAVFRRALAVLGDQTNAYQVVRNTFADVFRYSSRLSSAEDFESWIYRIAEYYIHSCENTEEKQLSLQNVWSEICAELIEINAICGGKNAENAVIEDGGDEDEEDWKPIYFEPELSEKTAAPVSAAAERIQPRPASIVVKPESVKEPEKVSEPEKASTLAKHDEKASPEEKLERKAEAVQAPEAPVVEKPLIVIAGDGEPPKEAVLDQNTKAEEEKPITPINTTADEDETESLVSIAVLTEDGTKEEFGAKREAESERKPEMKSEPAFKPELKPEPKPESKQEIKSESAPQPKQEARSELEHETKADEKEMKPEFKPAEVTVPAADAQKRVLVEPEKLAKTAEVLKASEAAKQEQPVQPEKAAAKQEKQNIKDEPVFQGKRSEKEMKAQEAQENVQYNNKPLFIAVVIGMIVVMLGLTAFIIFKLQSSPADSASAAQEMVLVDETVDCGKTV